MLEIIFASMLFVTCPSKVACHQAKDYKAAVEQLGYDQLTQEQIDALPADAKAQVGKALAGQIRDMGEASNFVDWSEKMTGKTWVPFFWSDTRFSDGAQNRAVDCSIPCVKLKIAIALCNAQGGAAIDFIRPIMGGFMLACTKDGTAATRVHFQATCQE